VPYWFHPLSDVPGVMTVIISRVVGMITTMLLLSTRQIRPLQVPMMWPRCQKKASTLACPHGFGIRSSMTLR
jgi:hypothetical protein